MNTIQACKMAYVEKIDTINTGGGNYVDLIYLDDGKVIGINDECLVVYKSLDEFYECMAGEQIDVESITLSCL